MCLHKNSLSMHAAMDVITFEHNESQEACSALLRNTVDIRRTKIIGIAISMLYVMLPQPHPMTPGLLLAPQCMLIPHKTLLIAMQISCVFPADTASDVQAADTTREVNTSPARADYLASPASSLQPPLARSQITSGAGPVWRWPPNWPQWPWLKTGTEKAPEATSLTSASTPRSGDAAGRPWRNRSASY